MEYVLRREKTESGVGYLAARPVEMLAPPQALAYLKEHMHDEFMRKFVLSMMGEMDQQAFHDLCARAAAEDPPEFQALLFEACLKYPQFAQFAEFFEAGDPAGLAAASPLPLIHAHLRPHGALHRRWMRLFEDNMGAHEPIPLRIAAGMPAPIQEAAPRQPRPATLPVAEAGRRLAPRAASQAQPSAEEIAEIAKTRLESLGVFTEEELRHTASLAPIGLMRKWRVHPEVRNGRLDYRLEASQISYGKGLDLQASRASLYMEVVERVSSFASIGPEGALGYATPLPLSHGSAEELAEGGLSCLDLSRLPLDAPYGGQKLYWLPGTDASGATCLVPAQLVFLFANLDEPKLFDSLDSTGLGAGSTMAQAKVSALTEVLERDAEAVTLFDPGRCFILDPPEGVLGKLFDHYRRQGIEVVFQDLTTEFGVPCYKAFVTDEQGNVFKGAAADLCGPKALVSALTETMFPFPDGPASAPAPEGLPRLRLDELPDHATGCFADDLAVLEQCLAACGHEPVYVDLTRADLALPVVKAFVPGLELGPSFGLTARVSPRLYADYLRLAGR